MTTGLETKGTIQNRWDEFTLAAEAWTNAQLQVNRAHDRAQDARVAMKVAHETYVLAVLEGL